LPSYDEARDLPPGLLPPELNGGSSASALGPARFVGLCGLPVVLADVITERRPTGGADADAHALAAQLRTMAANPLGL
jgi:hypothetical protein